MRQPQLQLITTASHYNVFLQILKARFHRNLIRRIKRTTQIIRKTHIARQQERRHRNTLELLLMQVAVK